MDLSWVFFFLLCFNTYSCSGLVCSREGSRDGRCGLMYKSEEELTCEPVAGHSIAKQVQP